MEDNKYYTPEIEEFHVGFEYETYDGTQWNKITYKQDDFLCLEHEGGYEFEDVKKGWERVKYLDQEDIESLGFDSYGEWNKGIQFAKQISKTSFRNYIVINIDNITNELTITGLMGFTPTGRTNGERLFRGKIKNKSELIKLLKQLEIYGN